VVLHFLDFELILGTLGIYAELAKLETWFPEVGGAAWLVSYASSLGFVGLRSLRQRTC